MSFIEEKDISRKLYVKKAKFKRPTNLSIKAFWDKLKNFNLKGKGFALNLNTFYNLIGLSILKVNIICERI